MDILKLIEKWDGHRSIDTSGNYGYFDSLGKYKEAYATARALYETKWAIDRSFDTTFDAAIVKWLSNFEKEDDQKVALCLLPKIMFYTCRELKYIARLLFPRALEEASAFHGIDITPGYLKDHLRLVPMTDSGSIWTRHIRQAFKLESDTCQPDVGSLGADSWSAGKTVIIIEDFVGTGSDAISKYKQFGIDSKLAAENQLLCVFLPLVTTKHGMTQLNGATRYRVLGGEILDTRNRCFSADSGIYPSVSDRNDAESVFRDYGTRLSNGDVEIDGYPLGFGDMQLTLVMWDNTPDNSLPVIWYPDKDWFPLFERSRRYHGDS